jgi:hypothetical protein
MRTAKNAIVIINGKQVKKCYRCPRRFVLEKGFYRRADGSYSSHCKLCHKEIAAESQRKKSSGRRVIHKFADDKCIKCGLLRRRTPILHRFGRYYPEYFVNKEWTLMKPACERQLNDDEKMQA